jgi:hypothetical protein
VTDLLQVVSRLEKTGGRLALDGDRIHYAIPAGDSEAHNLLDELRKHRTAVKELLRERLTGDNGWPPESRDAEWRFGQPHAKLFPFLGRKVRTPSGPGTLLQVFAERVRVLLDSELSRCSFFRPSLQGTRRGRLRELLRRERKHHSPSLPWFILHVTVGVCRCNAQRERGGPNCQDCSRSQQNYGCHGYPV